MPEQYVVFLRGINVGGHHKVPMAELKNVLKGMKFKNVITLLNSGNIILEASEDNATNLEERISEKLQQTFGFSIPTIVRKSETISQLYQETPFKNISLTKDNRLYVSFLKKNISPTLKSPPESPDKSFRIIQSTDNTILSVLDLAISKTPKAMKVLEDLFDLSLPLEIGIQLSELQRNYNSTGISRYLKFTLN